MNNDLLGDLEFGASGFVYVHSPFGCLKLRAIDSAKICTKLILGRDIEGSYLIESGDITISLSNNGYAKSFINNKAVERAEF